MFVLGTVKDENHDREAVFKEGDEKPLFVGWNAKDAVEAFNRVGHGPLSPQEYVDAVVAPDGFTKKVSEETWGKQVSILVSLKSEDVEVKWSFSKEQVRSDDTSVTGTTNYKAPDGKWYTFDRPGVDQSFYDWFMCEPMKYFEEQVTKAKEAIERQRLEPVVEVPGTKINVTEKRRKQIMADLKSGKSARITPSGFGVGFDLSTKKSSQWSKSVPAMATFFGVPKLYGDQLDCD